MSKIRGKDTKPELMLRQELWHLGYRYRLNIRKLPGSPDIVFKKHRLAIFVDGEFWHGKDWESRKGKIKSNTQFWHQKIERNMERDKEAKAKLEAAGWQVLRFWSEDVKNELERCVAEIVFHLGYFEHQK